ncbi:hypothetical protein F2N28_29270, partial [Escherichia coli]|nr:hypothetical protein [Escherichia coli]EFE8014819.1 hypothetical protein [Escherichia coli]
QSGQVSRYTAYSALFDQPRTGLPLSCCFDRMISRRSLHRALLNCSRGRLRKRKIKHAKPVAEAVAA